MRILILRLSPKALNSLLKTLWPMILSILIQILLKSKTSEGKEAPGIMNLILASLKLIELISILQFEEFYLHQWIFVFDCKKKLNLFTLLFFWDFGIKIEEIQAPSRHKLLTPFDFEPFIIGFLPNNYYVNYKSANPKDEKEEEKNEEDLSRIAEDPNEDQVEKTSYLKKKRNIIISDPNVRMIYHNVVI